MALNDTAAPGDVAAGEVGRDAIAAQLDAARRRSLDLLNPVSEAELVAQHSPLMSPLIWDLAHVANYEELWLVRTLAGRTIAPHLDSIYNPFENPRFRRGDLPFLLPPEALAYARTVRAAALEVLDTVAFDPAEPLLAGGYVYAMVLQHEHQHDETMLAALQLKPGAPYEPACADPARPTPAGAVRVDDEVFVPGGPFCMGSSDDPWSYDNEKPGHVVDIAPYFIDRYPVTNGQYAEFVAGGGYRDERLWTSEGWAWRQQAGLEHPQGWAPAGPGTWARTRFGWSADLDPLEPVQHVCWFEADAYARWAGKRLPTETEWEKAAGWNDPANRAFRYPWGDDAPTGAHANLDQHRYGPAPVGSYPAGASPCGAEQMIGDVWEWTASDFTPYPGFAAFPYREYSDVFFGSDYKVLRGGSWATHPLAVRCTFRNWDYPIRRQIFAGFRCARDA